VALYLGALSVLATGVDHIQQYYGADCSTVPTIGTLFFLTSIACQRPFSDHRRRRPMTWLAKPTSGQPTDASKLAADEFIESYVRWREACEDVASTYARWQECEPPQRGLAFDSYRAALSREEHAAHMYSESSERVRALER
jgi:hypothetical protein